MFLPMIALKILTEAMVAVIAVIFLVYGNKLRGDYLANLGRYSAQTAGVVSRQWKKDITLESGDTTVTWYVDYRYTADGREYEACSGQGHYKKMFPDGKEVTIHYDPQEPESFYVVEENGHDRITYRFLFTLGFIVIGIGVMFLVLFQTALG